MNRPSIKRDAGRERGLTLIELMVVMVILGILAAIIVPTFSHQTDRAKERAAMADIMSMKTVIDLYRVDTGKFPVADNDETKDDTIAGVLQRDGINWDTSTGPVRDPWGNGYRFAVTSDKSGYILYSLGADGQAGGSGANGDIVTTNKVKPVAGQNVENENAPEFDGKTYGVPVKSAT